MEEDVTRCVVAVSVQATKLMDRVSCRAFQKFLAQAERQRRASPTFRRWQNMKQLMGHGGPFNNIQPKGDVRLFDRVVRRFNVDYASHKVGSRNYLLFFKAGQADVIAAAFSEYTKRVVARQKDRPSILGQFRQFGAHIKTRQKEREKTRGVVQER